MSSVMDVIKRRRSLRKYLTVPVPKESLLKVLEAAGWAPSAHNSQPYRFIILENATSKRKLAEAMSESWLKDMAKDGVIVEESKRKFSIERFANAPILVVACLTMD
jgi:coenzyme F420-0:L-glutamate ligase/coenzyme F420-1:gamma-L-glutamate ligase